MKTLSLLIFGLLLSTCSVNFAYASWILVDNFEQSALVSWQNVDTQNDTNPFINEPQVTDIRTQNNNRYLLKKPAEDGIVGNRKALSFKELPQVVNVGETYTFYTRILVKHFPNNHAFGLSNLMPDRIKEEGYNAFEPTLRVTDKFESNGFKNDGTLMVKVDSLNKYQQYKKIQNFSEKRSAKPLDINTWYQLWYVVNNSPSSEGGQSYDVYVEGGEFIQQTLVFKGADFRMKRELPLIYFLATTNTGSHKKPYGNGGLAYDDIYMIRGLHLTTPVE